MAPTNIPPPPRTLNVKDFAESRNRIPARRLISANVGNNFHSHRDKRRRTTGYRSSKKRQRVGDSGPEKDTKEASVRVPRRIRRRMELRRDPESGFVCSGDGTKRLRTHLWHVKRFTMGKREGFKGYTEMAKIRGACT